MTDVAAAQPQPSPGLFARAIGVITSPKATFEQIVKNPKPVAILFLVALVIAISAALPHCPVLRTVHRTDARRPA